MDGVRPTRGVDACYINIITNGLLLTPEVVDRLMPFGLNGVKITLDGDRDTHNRMRPQSRRRGEQYPHAGRAAVETPKRDHIRASSRLKFQRQSYRLGSDDSARRLTLESVTIRVEGNRIRWANAQRTDIEKGVH